jgi:hypothetical protein
MTTSCFGPSLLYVREISNPRSSAIFATLDPRPGDRTLTEQKRHPDSTPACRQSLSCRSPETVGWFKSRFFQCFSAHLSPRFVSLSLLSQGASKHLRLIICLEPGFTARLLPIARSYALPQARVPCSCAVFFPVSSDKTDKTP